MFGIASEGSTMIMVLLVLLVLVILGITLLNMNLIQMKILSSDKIHQAAYYYAEAGLRQQTEILCNSMEELYGNPEVRSRQTFLYRFLQTPIIPPQFENYEGENVKVSITFKKDEKITDKDVFTLTSTCHIGNVKRATRATLHVKWKDPKDPDFMLDHSNFSVISWEEIR